MTVEKSDPSKTPASTNKCPDLRRSLVAAGEAPEKKCPWMVSKQISTKRDGNCNVLLVAPHGFPDDDDNVEILTCLLAEKEGLDCFAVVNNRKYNRKTNADDYEFWQDLNLPDEAVECDDFWNPLMECTNLILNSYAKPPLVFFIHGIGNDNADQNLGTDGDIALGAGYEGEYDPATATASENLVRRLKEALTRKGIPTQDGVKGYGATQKVPVLFKKGIQNEKVTFRKEFSEAKVEAIQLEIRCRGYRDSIENIRKLVAGLKEILTDTGKEGFQDYFTRESKALDGITIDEEFKSLIPRLSKEEYQLLEEQILGAGGCHDPLKVWPYEGKLMLLDGHHRREICQKHGLPDPAIVEVVLGSREEAIQWIAENQLGRRNLKPFQRIELAYRMEPVIRELTRARQKGAHKLRGKEPEAKDEASLHSDEILGKIAGVGARTYRKGRDVIERGNEDLIQKCREAEISVDAAFKQIEKPRKQKTVEKVTVSPTATAQDAPEVAPESVTQSPPEPLLVNAGQAVSQTDEPASAPDLPSPCDVIIVNVPWEVPSISVEKLTGLPIPDVAQDNCMVWLRATNSRILEAYSLVKGWGFEPKTLFTWIKQELEPAEWLNDRSEHYVVGVKGNPSVNEERKFSTALETTPAKDDPTKASQFYRLIEWYCSGERRLEVFSGATRDGWISWNPWIVDRAAEGMMREEPLTATEDEGSGKKTEKASEKGRKRQATRTKKEVTRKA